MAWFVPSGMKNWMLKSGVENVKELSWWDDEQVTLRGKNFKFSFVPAVHWCRRGANDVNKVFIELLPAIMYCERITPSGFAR